ncbi:unnamed protein product [Closterium sp. NIES-64]|nr:unnamed protein product [Closterium sp. NIES-64]
MLAQCCDELTHAVDRSADPGVTDMLSLNESICASDFPPPHPPALRAFLLFRGSLSEKDSVTGGIALLAPPSLPPSLLLPTDCLSVETLGEDSHLLEKLGITLNGGMVKPALGALTAAGAADVAGVVTGNDTGIQKNEMLNRIRLLARKAGQLRAKEETREDQDLQVLEEQKVSMAEGERTTVNGKAQIEVENRLVEHEEQERGGADGDHPHGFKIIKEELKFSRFLKIYSRVVEHPPLPLAQQEPQHAAGTGPVTPTFDQISAATVAPAAGAARAANGSAYGASGARGPIVAACAAGPSLQSTSFQQQQGQQEQGGGQGRGQKVVEYDIVSSASSHFICVLPFHSATQSVTLLKEYAQGANSLLYTVPCGGLSSSHASLEDCVRSELSEEARLRSGRLVRLILEDHPGLLEARLRGGRLVRLIPEDHPGLLEVKWCKNRFTPFLVIDPLPDPTPLPRDPEEFIQVLHLPARDLDRLALGGDMLLPSVVTCTMALQYLREHKLL